ncbi:hypothetical protein QR680_003008 [Steinernema hermaphroditum]|uniref:Uncharacterized protein n=1 Tax=Steinernema hermaphroditum TaxID=289476 RepID=A0AA39LJG1_9BILA|nr:hypothetical protein QR680_003008 [Steinernema hermaphroditum]
MADAKRTTGLKRNGAFPHFALPRLENHSSHDDYSSSGSSAQRIPYDHLCVVLLYPDFLSLIFCHSLKTFLVCSDFAWLATTSRLPTAQETSQRIKSTHRVLPLRLILRRPTPNQSSESEKHGLL